MSKPEVKTLNKEQFGQAMKAANYLKSTLPNRCDGYDVDLANGKLTVSEIEVDGYGDVWSNTIGIYKLSNCNADLSIVK